MGHHTQKSSGLETHKTTMGQSELQNFLMKEKADVYVSAEKLKEKLGKINSLRSMINYGEVEFVKVKFSGTHVIQYCYRLTRKGRGS